MAIKRTGQLGFAEALIRGKPGLNDQLDRLDALVDWPAIEKPMAHLRHDGPGQGGYPVRVLFKALILQALYGLSERELETAILDRISFRRFVGLSLEEAVPSYSVYCRFRGDLIAGNLIEPAFAALDAQLEAPGVMVKRGTMLVRP
jgi:transposase, IS5 family